MSSGTVIVPSPMDIVVETPDAPEPSGIPWNPLPGSIWGDPDDTDGVVTAYNVSGNLYAVTLNRALDRQFLQRGYNRTALLSALDELQARHRRQFRIKMEADPTGVAGSVLPYVVLSMGRGSGDAGWPNDGCHGGLRFGSSGRRLLCHNNQQIDLVAADADQGEDTADLESAILDFSSKDPTQLALWASSLDSSNEEQAFKPIVSAALPAPVDRLVFCLGNMLAGAAGEVGLLFSMWERQIPSLVA